jgi:hypothetical protein
MRTSIEHLKTLNDDPIGEWFPIESRYAVFRYCRECGDKLPEYLKGICAPCALRSDDD